VDAGRSFLGGKAAGAEVKNAGAIPEHFLPMFVTFTFRGILPALHEGHGADLLLVWLELGDGLSMAVGLMGYGGPFLKSQTRQAPSRKYTIPDLRLSWR
jgi:hypothetical protein